MGAKVAFEKELFLISSGFVDIKAVLHGKICIDSTNHYAQKLVKCSVSTLFKISSKNITLEVGLLLKHFPEVSSK